MSEMKDDFYVYDDGVPPDAQYVTGVDGISGNILEIGIGNDVKPHIISEKPNTTNAQQ